MLDALARSLGPLNSVQLTPDERPDGRHDEHDAATITKEERRRRLSCPLV
jgi:hypothetical protein